MSNRPRVIVGAHDSLTGLRALREAVAVARRSGAELRAVRAYPLHDEGYHLATWPFPDPGCRPPHSEGGRERAADAVQRAFDQALGGLPPDVPVRIVTVAGRARDALVEEADREDDLLVVGASRRRRWWWPSRVTTGRYCAVRANCPVLLVPTAAAARELRSRRLRWWRFRTRRELSALLDRPANEPAR